MQVTSYKQQYRLFVQAPRNCTLPTVRLTYAGDNFLYAHDIKIYQQLRKTNDITFIISE